MTDGPPVTVVDPRGAARPEPVPAPPTPWTRTERALAVAVALLLALGLAAARDLASRPPAPYVDAVASEVTFGDPGSLLLDVVLAGDVPVGLQGHGVTTDRGWSVVMAPEVLHRGSALTLAHDTVCVGLRPPTVVRVGDERFPVRNGSRVLRCDPAEPVRSVSGSLANAAGPRVLLEVTVVNASARDLRVTGFRYAGFRFDAGTPLPRVLPGRDPSRPLRMDQLSPYTLRATVTVADCDAARATLARAVSSERPDALPALVDGTPLELTVRGLEVYLDLLRRATCVR